MSEIATKWGLPIAERGFSQLPNYLIQINQFIEPDKRLSSLELLLLIQLSGAWWKKSEMPFPAMRTLAIRCGTSERQVLRAISHLEELNLLKRVKRRTDGLIASNAYDLSPLITILEEIAKAYPNEFPRNVRPTGMKVIMGKSVEEAEAQPKPMRVVKGQPVAEAQPPKRTKLRRPKKPVA